MNINSINSNTNFKSRNAEIRLADDIARRINQEFPRLSPSKIDDFKSLKARLKAIDRYSLFKSKLWAKLGEMRQVKQKKYNNAQTLSEKLLAITSTIKSYKMGNCGESAQLAEIAARANGIKDCFVALVFGNGVVRDVDFDHAVLFVKNDGKPYIIDPWLGFADYLPKVAERYQKDFRQHFLFFMCENEKVIFKKPDSCDITRDAFSKGYSEEELRKLYPELVKKSR